MRLSIVLGEWLDRPVAADLEVAELADQLGYPEVWIGEMAKVDAPALAAMIVSRTTAIEPCLGPLAVTVRSPIQIALAIATVGAFGRTCHVALGTSSATVARWHGTTRTGAADLLARATADVQALLRGERVNGFRLRQIPTGTTVAVAAFGERALGIAAAADRMVLNMVTPETAAKLTGRHPNAAVWLAAAVDPTPEERRWLALGYVAYLAAPGYAEMFAVAGFDELVAFARTRPHPKDLAARIPDELLDAVALVGTETQVRRRIEEYAAAGIAEIGLVVPPLDLACGRPTIVALAPGGVIARSFASER